MEIAALRQTLVDVCLTRAECLLVGGGVIGSAEFVFEVDGALELGLVVGARARDDGHHPVDDGGLVLRIDSCVQCLSGLVARCLDAAVQVLRNEQKLLLRINCGSAFHMSKVK